MGETVNMSSNMTSPNNTDCLLKLVTQGLRLGEQEGTGIRGFNCYF